MDGWLHGYRGYIISTYDFSFRFKQKQVNLMMAADEDPHTEIVKTKCETVACLRALRWSSDLRVTPSTSPSASGC